MKAFWHHKFYFISGRSTLHCWENKLGIWKLLSVCEIIGSLKMFKTIKTIEKSWLFLDIVNGGAHAYGQKEK